MKKSTFRGKKEALDWLNEYAEESEAFESKSEVLRDHVNNMYKDRTYKNAIEGYKNSNADDFRTYLMDEFFSKDLEREETRIAEEGLEHFDAIDNLIEAVEALDDGEESLAREYVEEAKEYNVELGWAMRMIAREFRR